MTSKKDNNNNVEFTVISASYFGTFKCKTEGIAWMTADFLNNEYDTNTFKVYNNKGESLERPKFVKSIHKPTESNDGLGSEGKKYDSNKPMTGTVLRVFPQAMNAIGACIRFGTTKYPDPNNWKKNTNALVRYNDSLVRHLTKHFLGKELDEETGLLHLAHVAWNALAILELYLMEHPEEAYKIIFPKEIKE